MNILAALEHTLLKPEASAADISRLCAEAKANNLGGVCVNAGRVALAARLLAGSGVKTVTVVGFPLGADLPEVKASAAAKAAADGADEIDMVLNIGALKDGDDAAVLADIRAVVAAAAPKKVKVIIECCLLTDEEKLRAAELVGRSGAAFVKTSTGFSTGGATAADVRLLAQAARRCGIGVKAAGGIRDLKTVRAMLAAGAERIGTSAGAKIAAELAQEARP